MKRPELRHAGLVRPALVLVLVLAACSAKTAAPQPAVVEAPVSEDMPDPPAPAAVDPPTEAPAEPPASAASPAPSPPAELEPGAGLRVVLDVRGWDVTALPGRVVVLDDDFRHLRAFDPATGAELWRLEVQEQGRGLHTLHAVGDRVLLHAGPDIIAVDVTRGQVVGRHSAYGYNGNDDHCRLHVRRGFTSAWQAHVPFEADRTVCATVCECSVHLFRCDTGAPITEAFRGQITHLYHDIGEAHDNVCWNPPRLFGQLKGRALLALETNRDTSVGVALDGHGKEVWRRPELAPAIRRFRAFGGDVAADTCWSVDAKDMFTWTCSTGQIKWKTEFPGGDDHWGGDARLIAPGKLLVRRRSQQAVQAELRELATGKRLWRRQLPAGHVVLAPGEDPRDLVFDPAATFEWIDLRTGATTRALQVSDSQAVVRDGPGNYLRVGGPDTLELDAAGQPVRTVSRDTHGLAWVSPRLLGLRDEQRFTLLRRPDYAPALSMAGRWYVDEASPALGPDATLLWEHRGDEPLRLVLVRTTD